ncbi:MAG: nucleoside hydrolase [Deltaproteobacteria bacterium]|nr:nucleoside hydrolase [Deltaproteobacteria bacterium]
MKRLARIVISVLFLLIIFETRAGAHEIFLPVIVDTDMALDDIRAIVMLLNSETAQIPLMVTSDGVRSPEEGAKNLNAILKHFNRGNTRIAPGKRLDKPDPEYRAWIKEIKVPGNLSGSETDFPESTAAEEIVKTIGSTGDSFLYLCLGPLTNLAEALQIDPDLKTRISFLIYFGRHPDDEVPGWNSLRDPDAARSVFDSGIRIYAMGLPEDHLAPFNTELYERMKRLNTPASNLLIEIHEAPEIEKLRLQDHFYVWDEMTVIYMHNPSLFRFSVSASGRKVMTLSKIDREALYDAYTHALGYSADAHLDPRQSVVLLLFPNEPSLFKEDVSPYVIEIIDRYGLEEWKACLLTNEFHRHLGIYSLIGAKMGIRAREILEAPFDTLEVISHAGSKPPQSCMNDGLQVSTGASLGRGTIQVSEKQPSPEAWFIYDDIKLKMKLKNEIWEKIKEDISGLVREYGALSPEYFNEVRRLSIQYWKDLDRRHIFDETIQ